MDIRKETIPIMSAFGTILNQHDRLKPDQLEPLLQALTNRDMGVWDSYPIAAIAHRFAQPTDNPKLGMETADAWLNYLNDTKPMPLPATCSAPLLKATRRAGDRYFQDARRHFDRGNFLIATEQLCSAVSCSLIGQAAVRGWPHANPDDDLNTVFGLGLGRLPQQHQELYPQVEAMSDTGHALNSNYAAVMGMPDAVRHSYMQENGYTPDLIMSFAKRAMELAEHLGSSAS